MPFLLCKSIEKCKKTTFHHLSLLYFMLQITSRSASKDYMKMIDNSYLGSSDEVTIIHFLKTSFIYLFIFKKKRIFLTFYHLLIFLVNYFTLQVTKLMERVEKTFIKHFANSNRGKGMNILRPKPKREKHRITFSMGKNQDLSLIQTYYSFITDKFFMFISFPYTFFW